MGEPIEERDAPSSRSLIDDGRTGLPCAPADVGAYADAMAALIDAPDRRHRLTAARGARAAYTLGCGFVRRRGRL